LAVPRAGVFASTRLGLLPGRLARSIAQGIPQSSPPSIVRQASELLRRKPLAQCADRVDLVRLTHGHACHHRATVRDDPDQSLRLDFA
jgi:hypothetical protein